MPCVQQQARAEHDAYVRAHRRLVDPYANLIRPIDLLKVFHTPRPHNELEVLAPPPHPADHLYTLLVPEDHDLLCRHAIDLLQAGDSDTALDIARCLVAFTQADINDLLRVLVSHGDFYPGFLFLRANSDIRDSLIAIIPSHANASPHVVTALAWIGDPTVADLFASWRAQPPAWAADLHSPPWDYSLSAGWELTCSGRRRNLFLEDCYPILAGDPPTEQSTSPLPVFDRCRWCGSELQRLFPSLPAAPARPDSDVLAAARDVFTCTSCTPFATIYCRCVLTHGSRWHPANQPGPGLRTDTALPLPTPLAVSSSKRSAYHSADQLLPTSFSQIGGHPAWIDDAAYPFCVACGARMLIVGQLHLSDFMCAEGTFYGFLCPSCKISSAAYQQT